METAALPVRGLSKAKRIAWSTPQNQLSVPFLKGMRERNKTRKVYDVNPYVEVFRVRENLYALLQPNLDGGMDAWSWLTVGPKRALLVGTGFGLGDTDGLARQLAGGKPVLVVNTHADRDQVLGNCRFAKVYCHEFDADNIRRLGGPGAWDATLDAAGQGRWMQFEKAELPKPQSYELVPVKDGYLFDLGEGYQVEMMWTGGHTPGHTFLLDRFQRRLFPGEGVSSNTMRTGIGPVAGLSNGQYATLAVFDAQLAKVIARMGEFDYLYPAHGFINLENFVLGDLQETVRAILAHPEVYNFESRQKVGDAEADVREKYVKGFATIAYTRNGLRSA